MGEIKNKKVNSKKLVTYSILIILILAILSGLLSYLGGKRQTKVWNESGSDNVNNKNRSKYNFSIEYDYDFPTEREDIFRSRCSDDKLYFFIESSFKNDTIHLEFEGKEELSYIVNTDLGLGLAEVIEHEIRSNSGEIRFSVNNSPKITFELIDKKLNLIGVRKSNKQIEILFYKRVPMYE